MSEVRISKEGSLSFAQASAPATAWQTASAAPSGNFGFCTDFNFSSGRQIQAMSDRGVPKHWKETQRDPIQVSVTVNWTGYEASALTASGATMPLWMLEFKALNAEEGSTGRFYQFYGVAEETIQFTEAMDGDTRQLTFQALGMGPVTGSGYLGNHSV